jgi:hypothetical protein
MAGYYNVDAAIQVCPHMLVLLLAKELPGTFMSKG